MRRAVILGAGDPAAVEDMGWLGDIDARIDGGSRRADISAANSLDARNEMIQSVLGTSFETLGATKITGLIGGALVDQAVGNGLGHADGSGRFLPTDNELNEWRKVWSAENAEELVQDGMLLEALLDADLVQLPGDIEVSEWFMSGQRLQRLEILTHEMVQDPETGQEVRSPLMINGEVVTVADWSKELRWFNIANSAAEHGGL